MLKIAVIAAALLATPTLACDGVMPPPGMREPTVPYDIYHVRQTEVARYCGRAWYGCTYPAPDPLHPDNWAIIVNDDAPPGEAACTIVYEKAHLAPNYWADPKMEAPETIAFLTDLKRRHATH